MFFPSEKREDDQKEMKGKAKEGIPDLDVLLFLHRRDARPSHVLLFMSEHSRGAFDFLLSSGPAIVFTLGYKPLSAHCFLTRCFSLSNFPLCTSLVIPPQKPSMMKNGSLAVAIVHRQVVVVKGPCSQLLILLPTDPFVSHSRSLTYETRPFARRLHLHPHRRSSLHRVRLPER